MYWIFILIETLKLMIISPYVLIENISHFFPQKDVKGM